MRDLIMHFGGRMDGMQLPLCVLCVFFSHFPLGGQLRNAVWENDGETRKIKNECSRKLDLLWLITKAMMEWRDKGSFPLPPVLREGEKGILFLSLLMNLAIISGKVDGEI